MAGGMGTGKIPRDLMFKKKKKEIEEQVSLEAIEWLLRKLRAFYLKEEIQEVCKHSWIHIGINKDTGFAIYRCSKCDKHKEVKYLLPEKECEHNWEFKDDVWDLKAHRKKLWFECSKCHKSKSEEVTEEVLYSLTGICNNHKWIEEFRSFHCDDLVEKIVYKCLICGKHKTKIICCEHIWNLKSRETIYKCGKCGEEKISKIEAV